MKLKDLRTFTRSPSYRILVTWDYLEDWLSKHIKDGLDLDPDFQRNYVWTYPQKSRYVEYALRGGISGKEIYFNCGGWLNDFRGPFVLVDGKQRINAAREFLENKLMICKGQHYKDFEDKLTSWGPGFYCNVNDLSTRKEVLQWYLDLNEGGTLHTNTELDKVRKLMEKETDGKGNKIIRSRSRAV